MARRHTGLVLVTFGLWLASAGFCEVADESSAGPPGSLEDCLRIAVEDNCGLEAAYRHWQAAEAAVSGAGALPDPRLGYAYFLQSVETRVGPQRQRFGLTQSVPWPGKLGLREQMAAEEAEAAKARFEQERLEVLERVRSAFAELCYLERAIERTRVQLDLAGAMEAVTRTRVAAGTASHSAVVQAQVELARLEDRLRSLVDMRSPALARLNAAMNRSPSTPLGAPARLPGGSPPVDDARARVQLGERNPQLQRIGHRLRRAGMARSLARKRSCPDLVFGLDVIQTDRAAMSDVADSGKDPVMASVALTLPVRFGHNRSVRREAELTYAALEQEQAEMERRLRAELEMALYRFHDAERRAAHYAGTMLPKAGQALAVAREAFEAGAMDFTTVLDTQRTLATFELDLERARTERETAYGQVETLCGGPIESGTDPGPLEAESVTAPPAPEKQWHGVCGTGGAAGVGARHSERKQ